MDVSFALVSSTTTKKGRATDVDAKSPVALELAGGV
jgi:hypothetical protein